MVTDRGDPRELERVNVGGTPAVIDAARTARVPRRVHVSTEAGLLGGRPLHGADETWPYPGRPAGIYPRTKAEAERQALDADPPALATVAIRPARVWGKGDTSDLDPGTRRAPCRLAPVAARATELVRRMLGPFDPPPLRTTALRLLGEPITLNDSRTRREPGYREAVTPAQDLEEMGASSPDGWRTLVAA